MPELPEVETLRRGLEKTFVGRRILGLTVVRPEILRNQSVEEFERRVIGSIPTRADRRGKFLLIGLQSPHDSPVSLCIHLKMRGQLRLIPEGTPAGIYHCLSLHLDDGQVLCYDDMWRWGEVRALTDSEMQAELPVDAFGPEPLGLDWTADDFGVALGKRHVAVKAALLDQRVVAGVGNIYADESLFDSGIAPQRAANTLNTGEVSRLHDAIRRILSAASDAGGTHSEEFVNLAGEAGTYQPNVYGRSGEPCPVCGSILERTKIAGRGTAYCSRCQT